MQQSIVKFLLLCCTDTAQHVLGITKSIIRSPSYCRCSLWFPHECGGGSVLSRAENGLAENMSTSTFILQRQFDRLLMMGIIMPKTCWAVSVRQSNKILRLIVASSWVFYLSDWSLCPQQFASCPCLRPDWSSPYNLTMFLYYRI
jgi:hypothetical protein